MYGMNNINIREPIQSALKEYFGGANGGMGI